MKPSAIIDGDGAGADATGGLPAAPAVRLAISLLTFVAALFACGVLWLACGRAIAGWLWLPALAAGAGVSAWSSRPATQPQALREMTRAATLLIACAGAALLFGAAFFDVSWDGQVYHQQAVLALAEGWNPLHDPPLPVELRADNIWINHYPKAAWIAQAILLRATGSLEASKGLQLLPLAAAALLVFAALRARGARAGTAAFLSALVAGNPVALAQAFSFYNDGMGASLTTAMLALTWHWRRRCDPWLLLALAACIVVMVNLKFTGLVYGVLLAAGLVLYARPVAWPDHSAHFRWFVAVIAGAFAIATGGFGFDPYVTNLLRKGHPFYPLMGQGAVDIITIQLAPEFHALTRPTRFLFGLFARADEHNVAPMLKWPFAVDARELHALGYPDVRIGGFGPLFGLAMLLAAAIGLLRRPLGVVVPAKAWALAALLVAIAFCNPALWWARYVPHLWLLPVGLLALALLSPRLARAGRAVALAFGALLAIDIALVAVVATAASAGASRAVGQQLDRLDRAGGPLTVRWDGFEAVRARLRNRAIAFADVDRLPCASPEQLLASRARVCPPEPRGGGR
jgi:hypothetical protein